MKPPSDTQVPARVLLLDDSPLVLKGLRAILSKSPHLFVVGTACTEGEAVALVRTCQPDVVVLDVRVGRASGIEMCRVIRDSKPHLGVLFFTANDDKHTLRSAILAGARGYLLKDSADEAIVKSIEIVAAGQAIIDQRLTQQLLAWVREGKRNALRERMDDYSGADRKVLSLLAAGKTNKEIAEQLDVAPTIMAIRIRNIYKRLSVSRRSEAAARFVQWEKESLAG